MKEKKEYLLGSNQAEYDRLKFQHNVWKEVTDGFLDKVQIKEGWKILDAGAGPGFVSEELRERTGESGEVTVLEPSEFFMNHFRETCRNRNWKNCIFINSFVEETDLKKNYYDFIFLRWVIDFVKDPGKFLLTLTESLKQGGIIGIMDYAYGGISLYPKGGPFDNISEIVSNYYRSGGSDPLFAAKIPYIFKKNNIELTGLTPVSLAGDNESNVFEWANKFFQIHMQFMVEKNVITQKESEELMKDWNNHKNNPETIFISPTVLNVSGKKS